MAVATTRFKLVSLTNVSVLSVELGGYDIFYNIQIIDHIATRFGFFESISGEFGTVSISLFGNICASKFTCVCDLDLNV